MLRTEFLTKVWKICDKNNLDIETETITINMAEKYQNYSKKLAYTSLSLSLKLNHDCFISLPTDHVLEIELIKLNTFKKHYFLESLINHFKILNVNKKIGPNFVRLIRSLIWYDIKANFYTIILAFKILKKYNTLYHLFYKVSQLYNVKINSLFDEYFKLKN